MNYKILENKFLLVDTNVLIHSSKNIELYQEKFFDKIFASNVSIVVNDLIRIELLRYAKTKSERQKIEELLKFLMKQGLKDFQIQIDPDVIDKSIKIANIYQNKLKSIKTIEVVDCIIAAQIVKYSEKKKESQLFLATENHSDFPLLFFDRVGIETIDTIAADPGSIHNIGFYSFNSDRYKIVLQEIESN